MGAARPDSPNLRTRRSALNFVSGVLFSAVTLVVGFIATPLLLRWLGDERYGAFRAAGDWLSQLTILELGFAGALAPLLALALGRGDDSGVLGTLGEGIRAFMRVAAAALGAGVLLALAVPLLVPVRSDLVGDLRWAVLIGAAGFALYPLLPFRVLAESGQRGYVVNLVLLLQSLVTTGLALYLAWSGGGIRGQFAALLAGQVVFSVLMLAYAARRTPGGLGQLARAGRSHEARAEIRRLNVPTVLFNLAGRVGLLTDNIVLALMLGPARVVPVFLTQRLAVLAQGQLQGIGNASWAALAELHALGRHEVFNARLIELTRLVAGLGVVVLVPIAAYNHHFVRLWVGSQHFGGDAITMLACINAYLVALLSLWGWCFSGSGQIRTLVPVAVVGSVVNIVTSVIATRLIGLPGPLLGTLIGSGTSSLWYFPYALRRTFGTSLSELVRAAAAPLVWGLPIGAALTWFARLHAPVGWGGLLTESGAVVALLLACWWHLGLTAEQRHAFRERARAAFRRR